VRGEKSARTRSKTYVRASSSSTPSFSVGAVVDVRKSCGANYDVIFVYLFITFTLYKNIQKNIQNWLLACISATSGVHFLPFAEVFPLDNSRGFRIMEALGPRNYRCFVTLQAPKWYFTFQGDFAKLVCFSSLRGFLPQFMWNFSIIGFPLRHSIRILGSWVDPCEVAKTLVKLHFSKEKLGFS